METYFILLYLRALRDLRGKKTEQYLTHQPELASVWFEPWDSSQLIVLTVMKRDQREQEEETFGRRFRRGRETSGDPRPTGLNCFSGGRMMKSRESISSIILPSIVLTHSLAFIALLLKRRR